MRPMDEPWTKAEILDGLHASIDDQIHWLEVFLSAKTLAERLDEATLVAIFRQLHEDADGYDIGAFEEREYPH